MIVSVKNRRSIEMSTIASFGPGAVVKEAFDELAAFATGGGILQGERVDSVVELYHTVMDHQGVGSPKDFEIHLKILEALENQEKTDAARESHRRKRWRIQDPPARVPMVSIRPFLQWCLQRSVTPAINPRP